MSLATKLEQHVANLAVGVPVLIVLVAIFAGGLSQALMIIGMSIVCTLGAAGVIWVPLAIGLGALVRLLVGLVSKRQKVASPRIAMKAREHEALTRFARRLGATEAIPRDVEAALVRNGWDAAEIRAAWTEARRPQS